MQISGMDAYPAEPKRIGKQWVAEDGFPTSFRLARGRGFFAACPALGVYDIRDAGFPPGMASLSIGETHMLSRLQRQRKLAFSTVAGVFTIAGCFSGTSAFACLNIFCFCSGSTYSQVGNLCNHNPESFNNADRTCKSCCLAGCDADCNQGTTSSDCYKNASAACP